MDTLPQIHWVDSWAGKEFEAARQRHVSAFYGASGPCGPCNQGRVGCNRPEVCFASEPSPVEPVAAPFTWRQKLRAWWYRHVVDHNVWE